MKKILFVLTLIFGLLYYSLNKITQSFGYSPQSLLAIVLEAKELTKMQLPRFKKPTFLLLGLDPRDDQLEKTEVTDTIILLQLNLEKNTLSLVSLPRDTWSEKHKFKINKLYPESQKMADPSKFLKSEFSDITGQNIDHVFVVTTQTFKKISQLIGPVQVDLPYSFVDDRYPNPDYISAPSKDTPIYKTVSFNKGSNLIDENNVLEFVRSRKGSDIPALGGTDLGRIGRQHLLIDTYLKTLLKTRSPETFSQIYKLYKSIANDLSDRDALLYFLSLNNPKNLHLNTINLPINTKDDVIYDPGTLVENQSVLLPRNNFNNLQLFLTNTLP